jgi:histidinol-phosphatase
MNAEWRTRYDLAVNAARQAGDLAKSYFDGTFAVEWKADHSPVTIADREAEQLIRTLVGQHFPHDGFLGEEFGDQPGTSGFRWIIDPIDGTKSFVRRIPLWGTLVGLEYRGEQVAGVCYAPGLNQLFRALRGDGAYRDDRRIRVSDVAELSGSLLCYSSISWFRKHGRDAAFLELAAKTDRQRGYGDFYGFVLVAQGSAEVMIDHGVHPWDVAALQVLVEEAGGSLTDWSGVPTIHAPDVIARPGKIHAQTLRILTQ